MDAQNKSSFHDEPFLTASMLSDAMTTRAILNTITTPMLLLDMAGTILDVNIALMETTGYARAALVGQPLWEALMVPEADADMSAYFADQQRIINERRSLQEWVKADGNLSAISTGHQVIYDGNRPAFLLMTAQEVSNLYRATSALRESEANYRRLVTNMNEGMGVQDSNGIITYANRKFADMLGMQEEDVIGHHVNDLLADVGLPIHDREMEVRRQGQNSQYELAFRHTDGRTIWAMVSAEPIMNDDGEFEGSFAVISDISARKEAERRRDEIISGLESFASTVAHDLKNPLNMVLNLSEIIEHLYDDLTPDQIREYLAKISRQSRKMSSVIDELMVLASVDGTDVPRVPLDMTSILQEVHVRIEHYIQDYPQSRISMPQMWPAARGHAPWIEEVWINYITNALKYGGTPPHIHIFARELDDGMIRFEVVDNGPGVDEDRIGQLFRPWERLDGNLRARGHGLGLSIVRRIVERLDGQAGVYNRSTGGAVFWFTLPGVTAN